jgi:diacylglycerol O-acyltransferase
MQRLTGLDSLFLNLESDRWTMHGAGVAILDPSSAPEPLTYAKFQRAVARRLHRVPPLRRRLVEVPLGLAQPWWLEDPRFDLDSHLHHVAVPPPGSLRQLADLVVDLADHRLDRDRPLWEMWFVEGIEGGRVAVVEKLHHACIDGMGGIELISKLFDDGEGDDDADRWEPEPLPSNVEVLVRSVPDILATPLRFARGIVSIANGARRARTQKDREERTAGRTFQAPRVSFNHSVSGPARKSLAFVSVSRDDVMKVKETFETTVNDVVLAICSASLRRYLADRGELPDASLTACVPVNIRTGDDHTAEGVRVSLMYPSLATDIGDPVERLRAIHAGTLATKHVHSARGSGIVKTIVEMPSPNTWVVLGQLLERSHAGDRLPPMFNACISNIIGPSRTMYLEGARLEHHYIMGMLFEGVGLFIPLMSYADSIDFGITAVRELTPDPWKIARGIEEAMAELVAAADAATSEKTSA